MGPSFTDVVGYALLALSDKIDKFLLLAVSAVAVALFLSRRPHMQARLRLGPRRPSDHARSTPATPAARTTEVKDDAPEDYPRSSPQYEPAVSAVARAIASQWNAESPHVRQAYRGLFGMGESHHVPDVAVTIWSSICGLT